MRRSALLLVAILCAAPWAMASAQAPAPPVPELAPTDCEPKSWNPMNWWVERLVCQLVRGTAMAFKGYASMQEQYARDPLVRARIIESCMARLAEQPDADARSPEALRTECETLGPRFPVMEALGAYPSRAQRDAIETTCIARMRDDPEFRLSEAETVAARCKAAANQRIKGDIGMLLGLALVAPRPAGSPSADQATPQANMKALLELLVKKP